MYYYVGGFVLDYIVLLSGDGGDYNVSYWPVLQNPDLDQFFFGDPPQIHRKLQWITYSILTILLST